MVSQLKEGLAIPKFVISHIHLLHLYLHLPHHVYLVEAKDGLMHVIVGVKNLVHPHPHPHLLHHPNLVKNGDLKLNGVANEF